MLTLIIISKLNLISYSIAGELHLKRALLYSVLFFGPSILKLFQGMVCCRKQNLSFIKIWIYVFIVPYMYVFFKILQIFTNCALIMYFLQNNINFIVWNEDIRLQKT